jgi:hypothetical protein
MQAVCLGGILTQQTYWAKKPRIARMSLQDIGLLPRQFPPQLLGDDLILAGLEVDWSHSDLTEVAALLEALLDINMQILIGQGFVDVVAGRSPRRFKGDHGVHDDVITPHLRLLIICQDWPHGHARQFSLAFHGYLEQNKKSMQHSQVGNQDEGLPGGREERRHEH